MWAESMDRDLGNVMLIFLFGFWAISVLEWATRASLRINRRIEIWGRAKSIKIRLSDNYS